MSMRLAPNVIVLSGYFCKLGMTGIDMILYNINIVTRHEWRREDEWKLSAGHVLSAAATAPLPTPERLGTDHLIRWHPPAVCGCA